MNTILETPEVKVITPEIAKELLQKNVSNRPKNNATINRYARDMKAGKFVYNGETIKISCTNKLLDGQHRLEAVVKSGIPMQAILITGLPDAVFTSIDSGRKRTAGDALAIAGVGNYNVAAAMVKFIILWEKGLFHSAADNQRDTQTGVTPQLILESIKARPNFDFYINQGSAYSKNFKPLTTAVMGGMFYILHNIDKAKAVDFFEKLTSGIGLERGCPILALRNRLFSETSTNKISKKAKIALIVNSWNNYRKGKTVRHLNLGSTTEIQKPI